MLNAIIADDNKSFDINLFNYLETNNIHNIHVQGIATNGLEVLTLVKELQPDVLLLDLQMPKMNGVEVLQKLKSELTNIPDVILITAYPSLINNIEDYPFIKNVFIKPFSVEDFIYKLSLLDNEKEEFKIYEIFNKILSNFEFNTSSKGYRYILDGLVLFVHNNEHLTPNFNLEKDFYNNLLVKYNLKSIYTIKWNVDKTVQSMVRYTKKEILSSFFPNLNKPTSKVVINKILEMYYNLPTEKLA